MWKELLRGVEIFRPESVLTYSEAVVLPATPAIYTDLTDKVRTNSSIDFISATIKYFYIGFSRRYTGLYVDLSTNGSYTGIVYEYNEGTTWKKLELIDSYTWNASKYLRWNLPNDWLKQEFTDTSPNTTTTDLDNIERYYIRISATTTTMAVISKIRVIPYATYTNPTKISQFLQLKKDFDHNTTPSDLVVEDIIRRAEDRIDYRTRKSWRFNAITEDYDPVLVDYNRYGIYPRHRNFMKVYAVKIWTGSDWNTLTEGRDQDYFVNYDLGMIYFTRLFLLPAAYGMTGRYFHFGFGEYKNSVQLDYVYGRDPEKDKEFFIVEDIATKTAAKDILKTHDYSVLIVSGSDKIPLESKVRLLEEEIEIRIEEITGVAFV